MEETEGIIIEISSALLVDPGFDLGAYLHQRALAKRPHLLTGETAKLVRFAISESPDSR
jgi:hypothetical protein